MAVANEAALAWPGGSTEDDPDAWRSWSIKVDTNLQKIMPGDPDFDPTIAWQTYRRGIPTWEVALVAASGEVWTCEGAGAIPERDVLPNGRERFTLPVAPVRTHVLWTQASTGARGDRR